MTFSEHYEGSQNDIPEQHEQYQSRRYSYAEKCQRIYEAYGIEKGRIMIEVFGTDLAANKFLNARAIGILNAEPWDYENKGYKTDN